MVQIKVTTDELEEQQQDNPLKEMVCGGHRPLLSVSEWLFSSFAFWQWILVTVNNAKCNQQKINMATNLLVFGYFEFS